MKNTNKNHQNQHIPVLLEEVIEYLNPKQGESFLDCTAGYGGHASRVLERTLNTTKVFLIDRDQNAIDHLRSIFKEGTTIIKNDYLSACRDLNNSNEQFDMILADLGVSSPHLDNASRGFSIKYDGPLDMRMDNDQKLTAEEIVNNYNEAELTEIIREYGEEPRATKIAKVITESRPIASTVELAEIIAQTAKKRIPGQSKIHPATRTFQALRIAVNSELEQIKQAIPIWKNMLKPGGRIVIISFHSLEDRIVKDGLREYAGDHYDAELKLLTKKPVVAGTQELEINPRARSAKLRAAAKIKTKRRE
ncbi:MAG: 16S rRNA (cytosine(1402)-N(4))-methyltransferase RsmH [Candidatus Saccharimonadales bacterium]